ncbi:hypothetical protein ACFY2W_30025 [Streptomyces sp. NPDC001262]|uniref:hypothetical protein n=1 Tax=unclassified Streptomyces TaxID=2593676 RepID=UPI003697FBB8
MTSEHPRNSLSRAPMSEHPTITSESMAGAWLVSRETHPLTAREAWLRDEPAILRTGIHFEAVRLSAPVVHHRAGSNERDDVERALRATGIGSAVIADPARRWYYALVPPGTAITWHEPGTEVLGQGHYLGVPAPYRAEPPGTHWLLTPPDGEGALCPPDSLREFTLSRWCSWHTELTSQPIPVAVTYGDHTEAKVYACPDCVTAHRLVPLKSSQS